MEGWNILDTVALIVLVISMVGAIRKGFSVELISLASVIAGFFLAVTGYAKLGDSLLAWGVPEKSTGLIAFVSIFILVFVVGVFFSAVMDKVLKGLFLKWLDRLLGGIFGLVRGCLLVSIVFLALTVFPVHKGLVSDSVSAGFFLQIGKAVVTLTPEEFEEKFRSGYRRLQEIWREKDLF